MKILFVTFAILVSLAACSAKVSSDQHIEKIEIAGIPYRTKTIIAVQPSKVYTWDEVAKAEIKARDELDYIEKRLRLAQPLPNKDCVDARLVCVIHWDGNSIDTLVFGEMYQAYNRRCYKMDSLLLRALSKHLPDSRQKSEVDYYIKEIYPGVVW